MKTHSINQIAKRLPTLLAVALIILTFVPIGVHAKGKGYVCNNSSTPVFIVLDTGIYLYGVIDPSWDWLKPGYCTDKNTLNVLAVVGRICSASNPKDCAFQFWLLEGGGVDVAESIIKDKNPSIVLSVIPHDSKGRLLKKNEETGFLLEFTKNNKVRNLSYSIVSNRLRMYVPVNGVGDGVTTPIGSIAHKGPDTFAIDYAWKHEGIDVYPVLPGKVVFSDCVSDYGCTVVIRHHDENKWNVIYYSIYAHLVKGSLPPLGKVVGGNKPEPIGKMGKTGTGSNNIIHLHFAIRYSNGVYEGLDALYGMKNGVRIMFPLNTKPFMR